jgi:multidrug efflux system membrane fusion protein
MNQENPVSTPAESTVPRRHGIIGWSIALVVALGGAGAAYYFTMGPGKAVPAAPGAAPGGPPGGQGGPPGGPGAGRGGRFGGGPAPVVPAPVRKATLDVRLTALGTVIPRNTVMVRTRVDGPLLRVLFKEGQVVKKGQLLAEIDPAPLKAALGQAEGQLARDQALLQNAFVDLDRYKLLMATESIPRQQYETQQATVRQIQGTVLTDRALVEAARLQLSYTRIVAPITGQVGLRQIDPGNIVRAGDANGLVTVTQMDPITVVASIPENQVAALLSRMREGKVVPVEAWDSTLKTRLASGKLLSTDNQIDSATGTLKLKAEFANADGMLFPNQFVNVRVQLGQEVDALVIPQAAVLRGAQGTYVYVVNQESVANLRVVTLGTADAERVAVKSGLKEGERVVVDGADRLREGAKVELVDRFATPAGKGPGEGRRRGDGKGADGKWGGKAAEPGSAEPARSGKAAAPGEGPAQEAGIRAEGAVRPGGPGRADAAGAAAPAAEPAARPDAAARADAGGGLSDAEREERRRRFREIMENGTDEQKAEARQRFRARMEAAGKGAEGAGRPAP